MIIEHDCKQYDTDIFHDYLDKLLTKQLTNATEEKSSLQHLKDISYAKRIFELDARIKDLKYKLDLLSGKPMI